ncbi:Arc family DNA-binding protein [Robbsia andropogonis]|uniref:Arc family DNA-binding protein n=1 Tax=Robbsia andropogonis TaxID=28092 RepID=UPI0004668BA8|nr:Arc family DNA-binding protein [Robbsia andropogonis]
MDDTFRSQFRLPWPLYEELKKAATKNRRPLNAELVARLESTFPRFKLGVLTEVEDLGKTISQMSLGDVMTPAEITMFAERIQRLIAKTGDTT